MTETIKVEIPDELAKSFRKKAMEIYGYKKGSIKAAMEDMIIKFITTSKVDWDGLRGVINDKKSAVELQHKAWNKID